MPARLKITDEDVRGALRKTGGAVAAAAQMLRMSTRTLQRRLKDNPELSPHEETHIIWALAEGRTDRACERAGAAMYARNGGEFGAYERNVNWEDDRVELEPSEMHPQEVEAFYKGLASKGVHWLSPEKAREWLRRRGGRP